MNSLSATGSRDQVVTARIRADNTQRVEPFPEAHQYALAPLDARNKDLLPDDAEILDMDPAEAADAVTAECWCIIKDIGAIDTVTFTVTIKADMYAVSRPSLHQRVC